MLKRRAEWDPIIAFLAARAVPQVERVERGVYFRNTATRVVRVTFPPAVQNVRVRRLVGLDLNLAPAREELRYKDAALIPLLDRWPELKIPGAWDGFELALRAVLGQQVTLAAARTLAGRLVELTVPGPVKTMPIPEQLLAADLSTLGMPTSRRKTLVAVAQAAVDDPALFQRSTSLDASLKQLCAIYGIGEWSANYIALRALRQLDAFPASDLVLRQSAGVHLFGGRQPEAKELEARAEPWRPWRGYVAQLLWNSAS